MDAYPAVSVVVSTYNRPSQLATALQSIYDQTYTDYEVWVVDDCTPDIETMKPVMEKWGPKFEDRGIGFYPVRLAENSGYQCRPKNVGIMMSNGDFIAYLDDDNVWLPNHLSTLMETILREDVDMVYSGRRYVNHTMRTDLPSGDFEAQPYDFESIVKANYIDTSDILHTKGGAYIISNMEGHFWDESLTRFGDWNFVWRWGLGGLTAAPDENITTEYHWHGDNLQLTRPVREAPISLAVSDVSGLMADQ
jgi:glycosyltransferase involved in cell wall biosynthesis